MQTEYLGPIGRNDLISAAPLLEKAAYYLQNGGLVAFPTETVYGLGASIFHARALEAIYEVKGREAARPLSLQLACREQLPLVAAAIPPRFEVLARHFLPGPLTVVVQRHPRIPALVSAGRPSIAIRLSADPIARRIVELTGCPLAVPSANMTGKPSPTCAAHALEDLNGRIQAIVDGGETPCGLESTVLSLENPKAPTLLRLGAIAQAEIEAVLGQSIAVDQKAYLSKAHGRFGKLTPTVRLFSSLEEVRVYCRLSAKGKRLVMGCSFLPEGKDFFSLSCAHLYDGLRKADREGYAEVLVICDAALKKQRALFDHIKLIADA